MSKIRAFAELTRPANVVTALSDIMAGLAIVGFVFGRLGYQFYPALFLGLSSMSLYAGGVVFNDVFDHKLDSIERPERALPSGRIKRSEAIIGGIVLGALGIFLAFWQSRLSGIVAIFITLFALFYDWKGKHMRILGPIIMGMCRAFNLLLGMSVYELGVLEHFPIIAIPLIYIAAITLVSRGEVHGGKAIMEVPQPGQTEFTWIMRVVYAFLGSVISYFALFFRPPKDAREGAIRVAVGFFTTFCFTEKALELLGWRLEVRNVLVVVWVLGLFGFMATRIIFNVVERWLPGALKSKLDALGGSASEDKPTGEGK